MKRMLNLLPRSDDELKQIQDFLGARWYAGVVLKDFGDINGANDRVERWKERGAQISVGLGDGSLVQWDRALQVVMANPGVAHINQPWITAPYCKGRLFATSPGTLVNSLVHPLSNLAVKVDMDINGEDTAELSINRLLSMLTLTKIDSVKLFPMKGKENIGSCTALAQAMSSSRGPRMLEPSGGLAPADLAWLYDIGDAYGVQVVPHLYSSIRDSSGAISSDALSQIRTYLNT